MPLIRYRIGDRGSLNFSECSCNRGLIRFNNIYGRIIDIFKNENGDFIYGDYFTHLFYFKENIRQFQVIQETLNEIHIKLVTENGEELEKTVENDLTKKIKYAMGQNCKVIFKYVKNINPSHSGKFIYTISKVYKSLEF